MQITSDADAGDTVRRISPAELLLGFERLFGSVPVPVLIADGAGRILASNQELLRLLGYAAEELHGRSVDVLVPESLRERHRGHREAFGRTPRARRMGQGIDLLARRRDGTALPVEVALEPLQTSEGTWVLGMLFDITVRKQLEDQLRSQNRELERRVAVRTADLERRNREMTALLDSLEQARVELERLSREDALTGLLNRREFSARAQAELRRARRRGSPTAIAMFDIDHFKRVNDTHGHAVGDEVLREVAALMREHCRLDDLLVRYGGEEFALLLPETTLADAVSICERMRTSIASHDWFEQGSSAPVTVSAGLVQCGPGEDELEALNRADALLYRAKAAGRNRVCS